MKTYYDRLGVSRTSSQEEIKQAYRRLAKQHHPDANGGSRESQQRFLDIAEAYQALGDEASRQAYDARLEQAAKGGGARPGGAAAYRPERSGAEANTRAERAGTEESTHAEYSEAGAAARARRSGAAANPMAQAAQNFEQFFGFDPKTGKPVQDPRQGRHSGGPTAGRTSSWFESYFGVRKK